MVQLIGGSYELIPIAEGAAVLPRPNSSRVFRRGNGRAREIGLGIVISAEVLPAISTGFKAAVHDQINRVGGTDERQRAGEDGKAHPGSCGFHAVGLVWVFETGKWG